MPHGASSPAVYGKRTVQGMHPQPYGLCSATLWFVSHNHAVNGVKTYGLLLVYL